MSIASTGSFKLVNHIIACQLMPKEISKAFSELRSQTERKRKSKEEEQTLHAEDVEQKKKEFHTKQAKLRQQGLRASMSVAESAIADEAIAKWFYAQGIPFHAANHSPGSYYQEMIDAIRNAPEGYVPPGHNKLAGSLLDQVYAKTWAEIKGRDPDGEKAYKYGATYVSDGWDSVDKLPLINSAFICDNDGGTYWRSVDTSGEAKTAEYCAALMIQDIYNFGCLKVVTVITDTCTTMRKAWKYVQNEFPWISIVPCQTHVLSLLLKDIGKDSDVQALLKDECLVVNWFSNHSKPLHILRSKLKTVFGKTKGLIKAVATRFGSNTAVGQRLLDLKAALQQTVVDPEYVALNYKDEPDEEENDGTEIRIRQHKGATARKLVLDDINFWKSV